MRRRSGARRALTALAVGAGILIAGVAQAPIASAHAQIVTSDPADGTNLAASAKTLTLVMSEAVELRFTKITLRDSAGHETALTGLRSGFAPAGLVLPANSAAATGARSTPPMTIQADLPVQAPDLYRITWTTVSSDDLHTTSGAIVFGVQRPVTARAALPADPLPSGGEVVTRWVALIGMGMAAGSSVLLLLLRSGSATASAGGLVLAVRRRLLLIACAGAIGAVAGDVARLLVQAHATGAGWAGPAVHLLSGGYGVRWGGRELAALGVAMIAATSLQQDGVSSSGRVRRIGGGMLVLCAGYALGVALTGHSGASAGDHPLRVLIETLHIGAALTWAGALLAALAAFWRPTGAGVAPFAGRTVNPAGALRRDVLSRFGLVAICCLAVMTITGLLLMRPVVASADALIGSVYGRLLLLKLAVAGVAISAAAVTALTVHPRLVPFRLRAVLPPVRLRNALALEGVAAAGVLLLAASLAGAQPAIGGTWAPRPVVQPIVSGTSDDLVESVQVAPNRPGQNFVTLDIFDSRRPSPAPITAVRIALTGPGGQNTVQTATEQGSGHWLVPTEAFTVAGRWAIDLQVDRPGLPVSSRRYAWVVADPAGAGRHRVISDQPIASLLTWLALGLAALVALGTLAAVAVRRQEQGSRRLISAPPSGAEPAWTVPPKVDETADTSARPSPVPGSSPTGWR